MLGPDNGQDKEAEVGSLTSRLSAESQRHTEALQELQAAVDRARAEARSAQAEGSAKVAELLKVRQGRAGQGPCVVWD